MATSFGNFKTLANFVVHATESVVYQAPSNKKVEVSSLWIHNSTSANNVLQVWSPVTGSVTGSAPLRRMSETITGNGSLEVAPKIPFVLDGSLNERVNMMATNSGSINVLLTGREEI